MVKAHLFVKIGVRFDSEHNKLLKSVAESDKYDKNTEENIYLISVNKLPIIKETVGKHLFFNYPQVQNLMDALPKNRRKALFVEEEYEEGLFKTRLEGDTYVITHTKGDKERANIKKDEVDIMWEVIREEEINKPIGSTELRFKWCLKKGLGQYIKEDGTFDRAEFFGHDDIRLQSYYILKLIQVLGFINYGKDGMITRLKDDEKIKHTNYDLEFGKKEED